MSQRSIVEFNHDFAHEIDDRSEEFIEMLTRALNSGSKESWENLYYSFHVTRYVQCHHSAVRHVVVDDHKHEGEVP
jgi:hypothetical protein